MNIEDYRIAQLEILNTGVHHVDLSVIFGSDDEVKLKNSKNSIIYITNTLTNNFGMVSFSDYATAYEYLMMRKYEEI